MCAHVFEVVKFYRHLILLSICHSLQNVHVLPLGFLETIGLSCCLFACDIVHKIVLITGRIAVAIAIQIQITQSLKFRGGGLVIK